MEIILVLLALFGIKHFFADFVWQTQSMVETKGIYGAPGGLHHAFTHGILTAFVLLPLIGQIMLILKIAFIDAFIHYHVDWTKQRYSKKYTPANKEFWFWFGLDQTCHYLTYIGIIAWLVYAV